MENNLLATTLPSNQKDQAILSAAPMLMMPIYGHLPELALGRHRFVASRDGIYLQARTRALQVTLRISGKILTELPYGALEESVLFPNGPLPHVLFEQIKERCCQAIPNEWAGTVLIDSRTNEYVLHEPPVQSATMGHIRYETSSYSDEYLMLDIHSHGAGSAFFSAVDDTSDRQGGIYIACVLGNCHKPDEITIKSRIVVNGIFYPVPWQPWETSSH